MLSADDFLAEFADEADELIAAAEALLVGVDAGAPATEAQWETLLRHLHTLKGNAGLVGLRDLQDEVHELEEEAGGETPDVSGLLAGLDRCRSLVASARGAKRGDETPAMAGGAVRIPFQALDALVDRLTEIVVERSRLTAAVRRAAELAPDHEARRRWSDLAQHDETLGRLLRALQDDILALRVVPLESVFRALRRVVHDEAQREGKQVTTHSTGGDVPLDKALLELAGEVLSHLVRNAVVHGIEPPEARRAAGKQPVGEVRITATIVGQEVHMAVEDDGRGFDLAALRAAAAERGLAVENGAGALALATLPGVSTRRGADLSAGRGVGLSAVGEAVAQRGGALELDSEPGRGSRCVLRVPLRVSIDRALILRTEGELYALPVASVVETLPLGEGAVHAVSGGGVVRWRGDVLPVLDVGLWAGTRSRRPRRGLLVVLEVDGRRRGLQVDGVEGIGEIVVKQLDRVFGNPLGVAGTTLLASGQAILILDPRGLLAVPPHGRSREAA